MDHIFYLKREMEVCSAEVTAVDHPYHRLYHVLFADGYENNFFTDVETGNWIEEDLGATALAGHFGRKVYLLHGAPDLPRKPLTWCKAAAGGKIICFGFYCYPEGAETVFEVYADNHKFLYKLSNGSKGWKVYDKYNLLESCQYSKLVKIIISIFKGLKGCI